MKSKNLLKPLAPSVVVLVIAFLGNMFVSGWNWSLSDFIIMGVLIFIAGLLVWFANMRIKNKNYKVAAIAAIVLVLLLTWIHLAVGIVGSWPFAGS